MGGLFAEGPVADASPGDVGDILEVFVGVVGESVVVSGCIEGAVPEGISVGLVEGVAGLEVGVAAEVVFEGFPGGFAVGVEEVGGFRGVGEVVAEGVPVFDRCSTVVF